MMQRIFKMEDTQKATMYSKPLFHFWASYIAAVWAFLFAAMSFYWAAGGTAGVATLSPDIVAMGSNPWFIAVVWGTAVMKVAAGVFVLALVQRWGKHFPRWILLTTNWSMGGFMVLYAGANFAVRGLMALGILDTPASMYSAAAWWHLILWDPWWLLGGVLFCAAAWMGQLRPEDIHPGNSRLEMDDES